MLDTNIHDILGEGEILVIRAKFVLKLDILSLTELLGWLVSPLDTVLLVMVCIAQESTVAIEEVLRKEQGVDTLFCFLGEGICAQSSYQNNAYSQYRLCWDTS